MPTYTVGQRVRSAVSSVEAVVVRVPKADVTITCAGEPVLQPGQEGAAAAVVDGVPVQLGKRYVDQETTLELLCVAAGVGELAVDGRVLTLKTAQPLPASD